MVDAGDALGVWPGTTGESDASRKRLDLPPGSKIQVTVGGVEPRLTGNAEFVEARQVGFRAWRPDEQGWLDTFDEWLDGESRPVQTTYRHVRPWPAGGEHITFFTNDDKPPVLLSGLLWGWEPRARWSDSIPLQAAHGNHRFGVEPGFLDIALEDVVPVDSGCAYHFSVEYSAGLLLANGIHVELVMGDWTPFPVSYHVLEVEIGGYRFAPSRLEMVAWTEGAGDVLPPFRPGTRSYGQSPVSGLSPAEGGWPFPTSLEQALAVAQNDSGAVGEWLRRYPDARVVEFRHRMGNATQDPASVCRTVDEWHVHWRDLERSAPARAEITRQEGPITALCPPFLVQDGGIQPSEEVDAIAAGNLTTAFLVNLHKQHFHKGLEIVECHGAGHCRLSTHAASLRPRVGETGAGLVLPGLLVSYTSGIVHQDDSVDDDAIGLPVIHPELKG